MSLEVATYINQLVPSNPDGSDSKGQGDDHLRLIKGALKNTFPNVTGAVTASQADLNKTTQGFYVPSGGIIAWTGSAASIPAGWAVCNGVGSTSVGPIPDLRARFLWGTDGTTPNPVGYTAGNANINVVGNTFDTVLNINQIPSHRHRALTNTGADYTTSAGGSVPIGAGSNTGRTPGFAGGWRSNTNNANKDMYYIDMDPQGASYIENSGGNGGHSHAMNFTLPLANLPPFYAVIFIIKL